MIWAAVLGYGTVGSGVVEVLHKNEKLIAQRCKESIGVKYILDLRDFPGDLFEDKVIHDFNMILKDPEITIVCETMGGLSPAYDFTKEALKQGKSVCTSNKELVAAHGPELLKLAKENHCNYFFEASVGGGIPIIRPMNTSLAPEAVERVMGILNGTTNFILTKMSKDGASFDEVLKEAQDKGYAERNPQADIEGYDACRKIAILSSLMTGKNVRYEDIYTEGISKITEKDFAYAKHLDKSIKLLAVSESVKDGLSAMVAPFMIGEEHPLCGVNGVFNAIYVTGNMVGDLMFYGQGAGKLATASAVVSDVMECAKNPGKNLNCIWEEENFALCDFKEIKRRFFVRVCGEKEQSVSDVFKNAEVIHIFEDEYAFVTDIMTEKEFDVSIEKIPHVISVIRMEQ